MENKNFCNLDNSSNINDSSINDNSISIIIREINEMSLIGKKRKLFNIVYPNHFIIFNKSEIDNYIKQFIKESLKNKKSKISNNERKRKYCSDNIRKKIKTRFLKNLKNRVNEQLRLAGSKKYFNYLQMEFISNISKEINKSALDLTFKELFSKNFSSSEKYCLSSLNNYKSNISVIEYLEKEKEISKKSKYDIFKDIKIYQIYEEYLGSKEFENDIYNLIRKENYDYIKKYIQLAFNLNEYFYN